MPTQHKKESKHLSALLDSGYICLYKQHIRFTPFPLKNFIFLNYGLSDNYVLWGVESGLIIKAIFIKILNMPEQKSVQ